MTTLERVQSAWVSAIGHEQGPAPEGFPPAWHQLRNSEGEWDSLDLAEFFMTVEEEFGVELPDRCCIGFNTIGDVVDHVELELARKS